GELRFGPLFENRFEPTTIRFGEYAVIALPVVPDGERFCQKMLLITLAIVGEFEPAAITKPVVLKTIVSFATAMRLRNLVVPFPMSMMMMPVLLPSITSFSICDSGEFGPDTATEIPVPASTMLSRSTTTLELTRRTAIELASIGPLAGSPTSGLAMEKP